MSTDSEPIPAINFLSELEGVINRYSKENASDTPDFVLARYMESCLEAFNVATQQRESWYGRSGRSIKKRHVDDPPEGGPKG